MATTAAAAAAKIHLQVRHAIIGARCFSDFQQSTTSNEVLVQGRTYPRDEMTNVTPHLLSKVGRNLLHTQHHPLNTIKQRIVSYFQTKYTSRTGTPLFTALDDVSPVVTTEQNFSSLLCAKDHPARARSDNYYINATHMLRAHTSAHQRDFIKTGLDRFLVAGDVYRRDEIDSTHYPVFHQMEGVALFQPTELGEGQREVQLFAGSSEGGEDPEGRQAEHTPEAVHFLSEDLKSTLNGLVRHLFGESTETRWLPCYFPFTHPSFELEIKFNGEWLEVLGSGVMRQPILRAGGAGEKAGWAFGLGLDRLAMLLFSIPDIRLLWSEDPRFLGQFESVGLDRSSDITFKPYSRFPSCHKDIAFWLNNESSFAENDFYELVRSLGGDLVEQVELVDSYVHPKSKRRSLCYRIVYQSMDRNITNEEINLLQEKIREGVKTFQVELR